jgi:hypothetical protein
MTPWTIGWDEPFDEPDPCEECDDEECLGCDGPEEADEDYAHRLEREAHEQREAAERWHAPFGPTGGP